MSEHRQCRNLCFAQNSESCSAKSMVSIYLVHYLTTHTASCLIIGSTVKFTFLSPCFNWTRNSGVQKVCSLSEALIAALLILASFPSLAITRRLLNTLERRSLTTRATTRYQEWKWTAVVSSHLLLICLCFQLLNTGVTFPWLRSGKPSLAPRYHCWLWKCFPFWTCCCISLCLVLLWDVSNV